MLTTDNRVLHARQGVPVVEKGTVPFFEDEKEDSPRIQVRPRRISIFGLGYVGAVSLACLARDGHRVIGVDIDQTKLDLIRSRKSPILEEGIQELMADVVDSGRVSVTNDARQAIAETEISFVCVGTPSAANGSQDLTAILRLSEQIGVALHTYHDTHKIFPPALIGSGRWNVANPELPATVPPVCVPW